MALELSGRVPGEDHVLLRVSTYQEVILEESDRQEPSISRASWCTQGSRVEWTPAVAHSGHRGGPDLLDASLTAYPKGLAPWSWKARNSLTDHLHHALLVREDLGRAIRGAVLR